MKKDDLTQVKNIGSARMKVLYSQGITTIQQLYETPLEKLEQVKSIGKHYAKLIKEAVTDFYGAKEEPPAEPVLEDPPGKDKKTGRIDPKFNKALANTIQYLKAAREKLKPIQRKKHLKFPNREISETFLEFSSPVLDAIGQAATK